MVAHVPLDDLIPMGIWSTLIEINVVRKYGREERKREEQKEGRKEVMKKKERRKEDLGGRCSGKSWRELKGRVGGK